MGARLIFVPETGHQVVWRDNKIVIEHSKVPIPSDRACRWIAIEGDPAGGSAYGEGLESDAAQEESGGANPGADPGQDGARGQDREGAGDMRSWLTPFRRPPIWAFEVAPQGNRPPPKPNPIPPFKRPAIGILEIFRIGGPRCEHFVSFSSLLAEAGVRAQTYPAAAFPIYASIDATGPIDVNAVNDRLHTLPAGTEIYCVLRSPVSLDKV